MIFSSLGRYAYIFQQLAHNNLPSPVSILEATAPLKGITLEGRSGDPSAFAGASILASLSNLRKDLSLLPPPTHNIENVQKSETPLLPSVCEVSDDLTQDVDMKGISDCKGEKSAVNENLNFDSTSSNACMDLENGKVAGENNELRPLLKMLAASSVSDFDLGSSISKLLDERREIRDVLKDLDPPTKLISTRRQEFKNSLLQKVISSDDIEVSFETFPYYLRSPHCLPADTIIWPCRLRNLPRNVGKGPRQTFWC